MNRRLCAALTAAVLCVGGEVGAQGSHDGVTAQEWLDKLGEETLDRLAHGEAADALGHIGAEGQLGPLCGRVVEALVAALGDPESGTRAAAAHSLQQLTYAQEVTAWGPVVVALSRVVDEDPDWGVRREAVWALGVVGQKAPGAFPALRRALEGDKELEVRVEAAERLAMLGNAQAVPVLSGALSADEPQLRASAATGLGRLGPLAAPAVSELSALLSTHEEDGFVLQEACLALGRIGAEAVASDPALRLLLEHRDAEVRGRAAWALVQLGMRDEQVTATLQGLLGEQEESTRQFAESILRDELGVEPEPPGRFGALGGALLVLLLALGAGAGWALKRRRS